MSQKRLNLNNLIYIADRLDKLGYYAKASHIDNCIRKLASGQGDAEEILSEVRGIVSSIADEDINAKLKQHGLDEVYVEEKKDPIYAYKNKLKTLENELGQGTAENTEKSNRRKKLLKDYFNLTTLNLFEALDDLGLIGKDKLSAERRERINKLILELTPSLEIHSDSQSGGDGETTDTTDTTKVIDFGWLEKI